MKIFSLLTDSQKTLFLFFSLFLIPYSASAQPKDTQSTIEKRKIIHTDQQSIEKIVHDYLLNRPDVIVQAIENAKHYQIKMDIKANQKLAQDPFSYKIGPEDAKVKIIEFFDYNCYFCKLSANWISETLKTYPNQVQVIFKEFPILDSKTKTSKLAARAALSAGKQGKYFPFHVELMAHKGKLSKNFLTKTAKKLNLDLKQFSKDLDNPAYLGYFDNISEQAKKLGAQGTPFFLVNTHRVNGADIKALDRALEKELKKSK